MDKPREEEIPLEPSNATPAPTKPTEPIGGYEDDDPNFLPFHPLEYSGDEPEDHSDIHEVHTSEPSHPPSESQEPEVQDS
jgi:hypothetical protein